MNLLIITPFLGAGLAFLVFLFFHTDFVYEYFRAFKLNKFFPNINGAAYEQWKEHSYNQGHYLPVYVRTHYNTFWSRLIGCPFCLIGFVSFWGCLFINPLIFPVVGYFGALWYTILSALYKKI